MRSDGRSATAGDAGGARIEARELSRRFGKQLALDRLSLTIEPGETFGLLGANGAGKTTFIRLVTGYLIPSAGELLVDGLSPARNPRDVQERLGFAAETTRLYPELRVASYLRFAGGVRGLSGERLRSAVAEALDRFGLRSDAKRLVGNLSKGFQQRVFLAGAFLHNPPLLIVDEPTNGLDPLQRSEVHKVLQSMRGRHTVLLCTHDLDEARKLTSRVAVLYRGRLISTGPTAEILADGECLSLFRGEAPVETDSDHGEQARRGER